MISAINSAVSGFNAATQRLDVSAQNIANENSANYTPRQLQQSSDVNGGVTTRRVPLATSSQQAFNHSDVAANSYGSNYPNNDPAQQLVQAQLSSYDAQGNLAVIKTENKLFQSVLNIVS